MTTKEEKHRERNRKWARENREKSREAIRQWTIRNPENNRESSRKYRLNKKAAAGSHTLVEWEEKQALYDWRCAYCGSPEKITTDHIRPLSAGGSDNIENIAPACKPCNSSKGNVSLEKWLGMGDFRHLKFYGPDPILAKRSNPMTRKYTLENSSAYHKKVMQDFLERLEKIKAFIREYWEREHYSPSIQDLCVEFHTSTSVVRSWLKRLEKDGWIEPRKPGVARNIVPVEIFAGRPVFPGWKDFVNQSMVDHFSEGNGEIQGGAVKPISEYTDLDRFITANKEKPS